MRYRVAASFFSISMMLSFGFLTLWGFYFGLYGEGFRPFDFLAVGIVIFTLFVSFVSKYCDGRVILGLSLSYWLLLFSQSALFVVSGLCGAISDADVLIRPGSGILLGLLTFTMYNCVKISKLLCYRSIRMLIIFHCVAFYLQFFTYHIGGGFINFHMILGATPRVFSSIFRPSGLFMEPSDYVIMMIMLLSLMWVFKRKIDTLSWIALLSIVLSESLFGVLAVGSTFLFFFWKNLWFWLIVCMVAVPIFFGALTPGESPEATYLMNRLEKVDNDASVIARYGKIPEVLRDADSNQRIWFGMGLKNDRDHFFGESGLAFLIATFGIIGTLLWILIIARLSYLCQRPGFLFFLFIILMAAPIWTRIILWGWLGLLLNVALQPFRDDV